ncbi:phosphotransferase family protein [Novosphingobium sp. TH158]|uniref:phosphotransferase family protein n=1 Tax=Novosphingobium sp. TH158 TaxID=2067455 RepID=UPI0020B178A3|nr:phosphotransferase [Novosphingobium sp. TH158]
MDRAEVPEKRADALAPGWLSRALGVEIVRVETVEVIRTVATKVRFLALPADGAPALALCLKGLLDGDEATRMGGPTMVKEADFYGLVAPHVAVQVPHHVTSVIDREARQAVVIMRDLIAQGAQFCSALDPFTADDTAASLEQLARLHAGAGLLANRPWITRRIDDFARRPHLSAGQLQDLLDDPRGNGLGARTSNASRLLSALVPLAERDGTRAQFLVHGDAHAGNIFRTASGPGLIDWQLLQAGGWALDVAYHVAATLPVEIAAREERRLLDHYLAVMRAKGCTMPDSDTAWREYREAMVYGFYLWAITRRVDPPIIHAFTARLGAGVERLGSFELLGV